MAQTQVAAISAQLQTFVGLTNGSSYLVQSDGSLLLASGPLATTTLTGLVFNQILAAGQGGTYDVMGAPAGAGTLKAAAPYNVFQFPPTVDASAVLTVNIPGTLTSVAGLTVAMHPVFYPPISGAPTVCYISLAQALTSATQAAVVLNTRAPTTAVGGGSGLSSAAGAWVAWDRFIVVVTATTWPAAGPGVFMQLKFV